MTHSPSLSYYSAQRDPLKRPASVTVVAILGIVLSALILIFQGFGPSQAPLQSRIFRSSNPSVADWELVGAVFGIFLRVLVTILMLVACCGVLGLRRSARLLAIVSAYAWIAMGAIQLVTIGSAWKTANVFRARSPNAELYIPVAVAVLFELVFPVVLMVTIRRKAASDVFALQPRSTGLPQLLAKPLAIIFLVFASICAIDSVIALVNILSESDGRVIGLKLLPLGRYVTPQIAVFDDVLWLSVNIAMIVGSALVLARRGAGPWLLIICALVKISFVISAWNLGADGDRYVPYLSQISSSRPMGTVFTYTSLLSGRATTLLWPALLLVAFTRRSFEPGQPSPPPFS